MPVSFLDLVPKPPTATVSIDTTQGPIALELVGVSLRVLADIGKRFPEFARALESGGGSIMDKPEALAALIAAALGHPGDVTYERHIENFPNAYFQQLAVAAIRLSFPQADAVPLAPPAETPDVPAAIVDGLDQNSHLRLSN